VTADRYLCVDSHGEHQLVRELQEEFGFDAELAAGMVSLAQKVVAREGRFSLEGLMRLGRLAYAQDPLLRLYMDGELPDPSP
jgi:hypothetical protein